MTKDTKDTKDVMAAVGMTDFELHDAFARAYVVKVKAKATIARCDEIIAITKAEIDRRNKEKK